MVITTLETIHRLLKIEKNEAEAALNETRKVLNEALHKMGGVENMRYTNDTEYDEAYAKVVTEEIAEAKADSTAALKRFNAARDALIDFECYQF